MEPDAGTEGDFVMAGMVVHCKKEKYDVYIAGMVNRDPNQCRGPIESETPLQVLSTDESPRTLRSCFLAKKRR